MIPRSKRCPPKFCDGLYPCYVQALDLIRNAFANSEEQNEGNVIGYRDLRVSSLAIDERHNAFGGVGFGLGKVVFTSYILILKDAGQATSLLAESSLIHRTVLPKANGNT